MNIIVSQNNEIEGYTDNFFKKYKISKKMKQSNFNKEKGFSYIFLFRLIFMLVFSGKNLYRYLQSEASDSNPAKDTIYRFLNSARYNWKKLLLIVSSTIIKETVLLLTSAERVKVLIVDDSLFSRNRSKAVELLARVYDHIEHKYRRGFRMLTLGWSDGTTFLPLIFSLLSSEKQDNRFCGIDPAIDKRTNGYKRRAESTKKATDVLFDLLEQVVAYAIPAQYLLFDSWFAYPSVIIKVFQYKLHTICMLKDMPRIFYKYMDKNMTLNTLYSSVRKKQGRAKILASVIVGIGRDNDGEPIEAKIVFVRDRNRSRKCLALLCTDISLNDEEIVRIYGKRWDIEVFFKMSKSYLKLAKEFQGRSYDAMVAHTTIVCCRYIMLAIEKRNNEDSRTIGDLFYHCCDEVRDIRFIEAWLLLMEILTESLRRFLYLSEKKIQEFMSNFFAVLPLFIKGRLQFSMCES